MKNIIIIGGLGHIGSYLIKKVLNVNNISHSNNYMIAVYNPPFQLIKRRNEIWVEVNKEDINKKIGNK